jgi:hypothetical protein
MISFKSRAPFANVGPKDHVPRCVQVIITSPLSEAANWQEMNSGRKLEGPRNYFERRSELLPLILMGYHSGSSIFFTNVLVMLLEACWNRFVASRFCLNEVASTDGGTAMEIFTSDDGCHLLLPLVPSTLLLHDRPDDSNGSALSVAKPS